MGRWEREESKVLLVGFRAWCIKFWAGITLLRISLHTFKSPFLSIKALRLLAGQRKRLHGYSKDHKIAHAGGRYYWSIYLPGFPSRGFKDVIQREILKAFNKDAVQVPLQTLILSISSRCHYQCEHCFEGENLSSEEHLSYSDLQHVMDDALQNKIRHMQIGGGEPMLRLDDLLRLMEHAKGSMEFWLSTSGYGLTIDKARSLKRSGLTGATISLDHWDKEKHNDFRKHPEAYDWALEAVRNCNEAGILTNLTLCVTRAMANEDKLMKYMELARDLNVPFVRFLEARKAGNYAGKDILLRKEEQKAVVDFYLKLNSGKQFRSYPIIQFPGYHQRQTGCFGAGNRYLHIDAKGNYLGCPFCRGAVGNVREMLLAEAIPMLQNQGCQLFQTNRHV
ncbi:MAG: radical SAM protein [Bacteroidota bacterium]